MPELPEVETIARRLREPQPESDYPTSILGRSVRRVQLLWNRTVAAPGALEFEDRLIGQVIESVDRRGKYLVMRLTRDWLLFHLRMSGDLIIDSARDPVASHDRLILELDDGSRLRFNDTRKFGRVWLLANPDPVLGKLGPEPLDSALTAEEFHRRLKNRRRKVKPLLLDQAFVAGIGNIYADEALFLAGIHPETYASDLDADLSGRLLDSIRTVLQDGIRRNGASIDWVYRGGEYQEQFLVYQRTGKPCKRCGSEIQRMVLHQRATHYCPRCQPARSDQPESPF